MENNPLSQYYRQPKIYISLPSKGEFYKPGTLTGDPDSLPVFGMTAMDEIMFRTPDALFSGEATVQVIQSCIPDIKDAWNIPQLDLDVILIALRIATYGQTLPTSFACKKCKEENNFDLDLSRTLDYFSSLSYNNYVSCGPVGVVLRPYTYKEITEMAIATYTLRRQMLNLSQELNDKEKADLINKVSKELAAVQVAGFKKTIASVETGDETVENQRFINEWLDNSDKDFFGAIKKHLEAETEKWKIQPQKANCVSCGHENSVYITLDNTSFFGKG